LNGIEFVGGNFVLSKKTVKGERPNVFDGSSVAVEFAAESSERIAGNLRTLGQQSLIGNQALSGVPATNRLTA
jgi:hypothetical protein